jgi:hypothetical protein
MSFFGGYRYDIEVSRLGVALGLRGTLPPLERLSVHPFEKKIVSERKLVISGAHPYRYRRLAGNSGGCRPEVNQLVPQPA